MSEPASATVPRPDAPARLESVDVLRGVAMILMALDHTRDYFTDLRFDPESLGQTWGALFLARWVTHFCAPLFFFLAGTGAFFYGLRRTPRELRRFLWTRGLWLIVLEFTLVGFGWTFVAPWGFFGVIWALGGSMLLLALVVRLPVRWIAAGSLAVICLHDLLDGVRPEAWGRGAWLWSLLHVKGPVMLPGLHLGSFVLFPLVPWCAVMALGYAFGALLRRPDGVRWSLRLGLAATLAFVALRATNLYGNPPALRGGVTPGDWHPQPTFEKSWILFLDVEKYPPSLQFLLMTLGPSLIALAALERSSAARALRRPLAVYGRVPLFFYLLHLYAIHGLAVAVALLAGQPAGWLLRGAFWLNDTPPGYGHGLTFVVGAWLAVVAMLYLPCRAWAGLKQRRRDAWLSYL